MRIKKLAGFALGIFGTFLMWQSGVSLAQYFHANGTERLSSLLFDPEYSLRMISAMAAFIAGLAALTERQGGAWLAGFAAALLAIQTLAMLGGHGHVYAWHNEAVYLIILTGLFLTMVVSQGPAEDAEPA
ncbi:MAG: hypothetical protein L3J02_00660 [Henriciella sp.]|nr:hypothetical protein [Henriciella sp.]